MARRWLWSALLLAVGFAAGATVRPAAGLAAQPPAAMPPMPPPSGAAAPPSAVVPLAPAKPFEWPKVIADKPIGYYIGELTSPDPTVREQAVKTLPYFGPQAARQATRQLLQALDDRDPGVRVNAILALAGIGLDTLEEKQKAAFALRTAVTSTAPGSVIRLYAARLLGVIGPDAHSAMEALSALTKDPAWETRDAAAMALGRVGAAVYDPAPVPPGGVAVLRRAASGTARARLTDLLKDPSKAVRLEAIQSQLLLGPPTSKDPDQYVKEAQPHIDEVLRRLGPGTDKAPAEKDPSVRLWLHALVLMYDDRQAAAAVKEMAAAVTALDPAVRVQGLTALTVCGPLAGRAVEEVRLALRAKEPEVAKAAVMCLLRMGAEGRKAVADLQAVAAAGSDDELKRMAAEVARLLSPGAVPAGK